MYDVRILLWMCLTIPLSKAYYDEGKELFVFDMDLDSEKSFHDELFRVKRDSKESNITTKVTHLKNAFQQQLLVHWSGQGSNVMVCLAKNSLPIELGGKPTPSGVYISYDYGGSFENKTDLFKIDNSTYASIDTFFSHKKERRFIMFLDKFHKVLFLSENYGKELKKVNLTFTPSDILPHPSNPYIFLIYDTDKTLHLTKDYGESFSVAQVMVKSYFFAERWPNSYGDTSSRTLLVQRIEPNSTSAIAIKDIGYENQNVLLLREKIEGFFMAGDFLFVTFLQAPQNVLELNIAYKGGEFRSAIIDFEGGKIGYVVADVTDKRILLAVAHSETLTNLYVCEYKPEERNYVFRLSLERVFSYIPNIQWKNSWLSDVTETMFADVYKVQGMKGIYLASQIKEGVHSSELNPAHLTSVITYDWGGEWNPLKPPQYDEHMTPYRCELTAGCSLHVTQKFSLLYPVTRSLPLLSSSSAPGIILGTGTVGTSLKDKAGIFISRDAGLTWNKILRENYLFNMGNHGGIIVVVKSFRSSGETNEIFYSLDEGETWEKHIFTKTPIKVYGLMTEPGESSTVFTVFGSESTKHEWLIVNINLKNAFQRNCSSLYDFKNWSPSSKTSAKLGCVMGKKDTYRRRLKHAACFINGSNDQPVSSIPCPCSAEDYECDAGFMRRKINNTSTSECIPSQKAIEDPYRIPDICEPGTFYNRTKGYRKIAGDVCFEGYQSRSFVPDKIPCPIKEEKQFLLVAGKDKIYRVDLTDPKTEILPVKNLNNVISLDYDMKKNCVYFADIVDDVIGRQCFSSGKDNIEYLVTKHLVSVEGIAFDWISNMLFIVDGKEAKIDVIRTDVDHSGRMRATILDKTVLDKPRGIAVHPMAGYLFWTDWSKTKPTVSRAHLDGSNVKLLFSSPLVVWPNGITIDHIAERIYWVDAKLDYIASSNLDGKNFIKVIEKLPSIKHPFSVAVFKDDIYWDDWSHPKILSAYKETLETTPAVKVVINITENLMDLKVFAHGIQEGTNACSKNKTCSHLCFALPDNAFRCGCPEGFVLDSKGKCLCMDGSKPGINDTCPKSSNSSCPPQHFSCAVTGACIPDMWRCDGEYDCEDGSDERNCEVSCPPNTFMCNSSKICIPRSWACDGDNDCSDFSDEMNCSKRQCKNTEFTCKNKNCISQKWVCDGDDDCKDGSDEATCDKHIKTDNCTDKDFMCKSGAVPCVPKGWACDGEHDCLDGSDEMNCTMKKCDDFQFRCKISNRCIMKYWVCDGVMDCGLNDNSDEENCTKSNHTSSTVVPPIFKECRKDMFSCANSLCIPSWWKCDKVDDCGDNSDEEGCHYENKEELPQGPIIPSRPVVCHKDQFQCEDEECIWQSWVCDGSPDCVGGEDEKNCENHFSCADVPHSFKCRTSHACINLTNVCDGVYNCPDRSDEENCNSKTTPESSETQCNTGFFLCDQVRCLPLSKMCDGVQNCYDYSDEKNCSESKRTYQVQQMFVDDEHRTSTSIPIQWWIKTQKNFTFQFLPSISLIDREKPRREPTWKNHTRWITADAFIFENLTPGEFYNITVYVKAENKIYTPSLYVTSKTLVDLPSPPWNLIVKQNSLYEFEASWNPPMHKNGEIIKYVVYVSPPLPPMETSVSAAENTTSIIGYFSPGNYYTFWVLAINELGASNSSQVVSVMSDDLANVQGINNLREDSSAKKNYTSISLIWDKVTNATGYKIAVTPPIPYARIPSASTPNNKYTFINLAPGVQYLFHVNAYVKTYDGPKSPISLTTIGEELPIVPGLTVKVAKHIGTTVNLEWNPPKSVSYKADWEYGIYYGVNSRELLEMPRNRTKNMSAVITNLEACSKYMFDISVVGPYGQGPLTATPVSVLTGYDIKAAPKNLWVTRGAFNTTLMQISWESSCFNMAEPIRYIISIHDQVLSQTSYITLFPSNKTKFTHSVVVEYGSKYSIWVQTETGMPTKPLEYWAPFLPVPHEVQVLFHPDSHCSVYWNMHSDLEQLPKIKYEVLVSEGPSLNETTAKIYVVDKPPFNLTDMKSGVMYSFAVRTLSEKGYRSLPSEITTVPVPLGAWASVMTPSRVASFVIPITLVLIISIAVLAVFIIRHRRLQNSFTSFANSHYSTRSGAATFTTDGFDDEDSPVIRGFSDDEPLVVA